MRTIIEISHDEIFHLVRDTDAWSSFLTGLKCGEFANGHPIENPDGCRGIRLLGQRHHSEPEWAPDLPLLSQATFDKERMSRALAGESRLIPSGLSQQEICEFILRGRVASPVELLREFIAHGQHLLKRLPL